MLTESDSNDLMRTCARCALALTGLKARRRLPPLPGGTKMMTVAVLNLPMIRRGNADSLH